MTTPIHILCSSFTEIVRRKWVQRCVVLVTKSSRNAVVFGAISYRFGGGRQKFAGYTVPCDPIRLPIKFRRNRFRHAGVIPEKMISYEYSPGHIINGR